MRCTWICNSTQRHKSENLLKVSRVMQIFLHLQLLENTCTDITDWSVTANTTRFRVLNYRKQYSSTAAWCWYDKHNCREKVGVKTTSKYGDMWDLKNAPKLPVITHQKQQVEGSERAAWMIGAGPFELTACLLLSCRGGESSVITQWIASCPVVTFKLISINLAHQNIRRDTFVNPLSICIAMSLEAMSDWAVVDDA